jgi:hypothetical protein
MRGYIPTPIFLLFSTQTFVCNKNMGVGMYQYLTKTIVPQKQTFGQFEKIG